MKALPEKIMIVGTDTSVGKTLVAALLLDYLKTRGVAVGYLKLVSCGGAEADDCRFCAEKSGVRGEAVYHFRLAASPHLAGRQQGEQVDLARLAAALAPDNDRQVLVVEGAGGLCVPLNDETLLVDFLAAHPMATLLVARSGLGTLNHTLLSIEALRHRGIPILGILFSDEQAYAADDLLVCDNMATIARLTGLPVLGRLPHCPDFSAAQPQFAAIGQTMFGR